MEETADACMQKRGGKSFSGSMMMTMMMPSSKRNRERDCDIHWLTRWLVGWWKSLDMLLHGARGTSQPKGCWFPILGPILSAPYSPFQPMYKLLFFRFHTVCALCSFDSLRPRMLPSQKLLFAYFIFHRVFIRRRFCDLVLCLSFLLAFF